MDNSNKNDILWPNANRVKSNCTQIYPLDRMLNFQFSYKGKINLQSIDCYKEFFKRNQQLQNQIIQFLIQMIEGICSTAFNLLVNDKCGDKEAKCYAAKNMLENIKYLCCQISRLIKDSEYKSIKREQRVKKIDNLIRQIVDFISLEIKVYVQQIFHKYPSAPLSGYSQKLKNAIRSIDCRQDYTYDFLQINNLKVGSTGNTQELISQIMVFLNKVKNAPYEKIEGRQDENGEEETYEKCFQKFNQNLVWIISQKSITQKMIEGVDPFTKSKQQKCIQNTQLFQFLISPSQENLLRIMKQLKGYKQFHEDWQFIQKYQQQLSRYQREHKLSANAKISKNTPQFQESQIKNAELRFKSSALLRVLVKWVEDLKQTLNESKKYIRDNGFKFKIIDTGKTQVEQNTNLVTLDQGKRKILEQTIKKVSKLIDKKNLSKINMFLVDSLMEQEQSIPHYNFQNSLKLSSQVNSYIGKQTVEQLINLIGIFNRIPQNLQQKIVQHLKKKNLNNEEEKGVILQQLRKVNLISNRIGDLLRSKVFCTQSQFIKLLTLLYQLDKYCYDQINKKSSTLKEKNINKLPFFKLIRIKNKLKDTTNNVHINYMFYGKLQCQLQICFISQNDKRIQKTNTMHHFLYELKRGIYGVIPELANIVNQNDPICQSNQKSNLSFIKYSLRAVKHHQFQERRIGQSDKKDCVWRCIYKGCNEFSLQYSKRFIERNKDSHQYQCIKCYIQKTKPQQNLCITLKKLQYSKSDEWLRKILEIHAQLQIQEIKENEQDISGVYLMIYPTEKRVITKFYTIFKHEKNEKLVTKCLQENSQKATEFKTKEVTKEHKSFTKFYLKVNRIQLIRYLKEGKIIQKTTERIMKYLSKEQIRNIQSLATKQVDRKHFSKQIQNRQQEIRLNQMKSIKEQLSKELQKQQELVFVQRIYAQSIQLPNILPLSKFPNLRQLHLKRNNLSDSLSIKDHQFLTYIDLSQTWITKIQLMNLKSLKDAILSFTRLEQYKFSGLINLQNLQMQRCRFKEVTFEEQLPSLQRLNIYNNLIAYLDLSKCPSLKSLNCDQFEPVNLINLVLNDKVTLQSIKSGQLLSLLPVQLHQLQTVQLSLDAQQIYQICFKDVQNHNYSYRQMKKDWTNSWLKFEEYKFNTNELKKLKDLRIKIINNAKRQEIIKYNNQNEIGIILQQFIANQPNLSQFHLSDYQDDILIQHLDLSRIQRQIQDLSLYIPKTLLTLKINKVAKLLINSKSIQLLQIQSPENMKQLNIFNCNEQVIPSLLRNDFFKKCVNIQIIRNSFNQGCHSYELKNLKHIKQIQFTQQSIQQLVCDDGQDPLSHQNSFSAFQKVLFYSMSERFQLGKGCIQLSRLKEFSICRYEVRHLKIKIPLKIIKIIKFYSVVFNQLYICYYEQSEKADLQQLIIDFNSLDLLKTHGFFQRINTIKHIQLYEQGSKQEVKLSQICKNVEQLTLAGNNVKLNRIIIDTPIKTINLPSFQDQITFQFANFTSKNNKRQKIVIFIRRQCLQKANFINKTKNNIDVVLKSYGFKSQQTFLKKNQGKNIQFTFISELLEDQSEKEFIQNLSQKRREYKQLLQICERFLKDEKQQNLQVQQQIYLIQILFQCSQQYKQLLEICYRQTLEDFINEQEEDLLDKRKRQLIQQLQQRIHQKQIRREALSKDQ